MHIDTYAYKQAEPYSNNTTNSNININATHAYNLMNAQNYKENPHIYKQEKHITHKHHSVTHIT